MDHWLINLLTESNIFFLLLFFAKWFTCSYTNHIKNLWYKVPFLVIPHLCEHVNTNKKMNKFTNLIFVWFASFIVLFIYALGKVTYNVWFIIQYSWQCNNIFVCKHFIKTYILLYMMIKAIIVVYYYICAGWAKRFHFVLT